MVKTVDEFFTMQEILDFLKAQADGRAPEDDEAGVLYAAREFIINELELLQGRPKLTRDQPATPCRSGFLRAAALSSLGAQPGAGGFPQVYLDSPSNTRSTR